MSISTVIVPSVKIEWRCGIPFTPTNEEIFYIDEWNVGTTPHETIPFTRIATVRKDDFLQLPYETIVKGLLSWNVYERIDAFFEAFLIVALGKYNARERTLVLRFQRPASATTATASSPIARSSIVIVTWNVIPNTDDILLLGIEPFASLEGIATIFGVSIETLRNLFCTSVAYFVSRRGVVYYHANKGNVGLGKILFVPQHTGTKDEPIKNILTAFREVVEELIRGVGERLIFESPVEERGSQNYSARAFRKMPQGLPEAFAEALSHGYVMTIEASSSAMVDVLPWIKSMSKK